VERTACDLNSQSLPFWEGSLKRASFSDGFSASVETSRGCPFHCSFCPIPGFYGPRPRYKSIARIVTELRALKGRGVSEVYFIDDSFATRPQLARELFEAMLRERLNLRFTVQVRADIIRSNPDLAELGARAGLFMAIVGFEGYTSAVQTDADKGNSNSINREAARLLRNHGIAVYGTHIFGSPRSLWRDNLQTFAAGRRNSDLFRMTIFTPLPGSPLYAELIPDDGLNSSNPADFYYGKYLIRNSHIPALVEAGYFGLLALHYALPDTLWKAWAHPNPVIRTFHRRAYCGALRFILGRLTGHAG
jgi:radical SAM superfamily enzyme YgiQ (UPF0313 family)